MDGPSPLEQLPKFFTIGRTEGINIVDAMRKPLSGYLGGIPTGGYWVERLASEWCDAFKVKHAIPCNSATSGLLAACLAVGIGPDSVVWTTAYSMSATAACAKVLGAHIVFIDIETTRFSINMNNFGSTPPKAIIVTNLFGHPAYLQCIRSWCDSNKVVMIEDNAQSPFAREGGHYAGTIGHIGVFSLNIHKHIQAGEGGVVVTNDSTLAHRLQGAINHGELGGSSQTGLNLRITEPTAAIACAQLVKAPVIMKGRIALAEEMIDMFYSPWVITPERDIDCTHSYYIAAFRVLDGERQKILDRLWACNFPIRKGYSPTLNRIFNGSPCPVAEKLEDEELITFEVCSYDPKPKHLKHMREIVKWATDDI
jgi:dTDP-4-amino-4,6-dideoxygalactose transaminase